VKQRSGRGPRWREINRLSRIGACNRANCSE
jgi:hypothetical protein